MKTVTLTEYRTETAVALTPGQRRQLRGLADSIQIEPADQGEGLFDLTPKSTIGTLRFGELAIEIRPKLPLDRVLFMISYALDPVRWRESLFSYAGCDSLTEALALAFARMVSRTLARGLLQGYRQEEAARGAVRGRIRLDDQIRLHFGRVPPIEVRYDEFTADIEENRVLRAALWRLGMLRLRSTETRRLLRAGRAMLDGVSLVEYDPRRLPAFTYTRLNQHYRQSVELALLILRCLSFEQAHGAVECIAFLVDMNVVFERFVAVALREALKVTERSFPQNMRGRASLYLDAARRVRLKPDLSWWDGARCVFVGDIKYKRVQTDGVLHPDLYQLLAYTLATGLPQGMLIYAAGEGEPATHRIPLADKRLDVTALNLSGEPTSLLGEIEQIARRIRAQRALSPALTTADTAPPRAAYSSLEAPGCSR
ncbi:MAG TPA: hypothetical protein VFY89_05205 [Ktedonobacterales bacterium]